MTNKKLTIKEVSNYIGVTEQTIRNWEKQGKITPSYTEGGHRRYSIDDVNSLKLINPLDISVQLYGNSYSEGELTQSILNKQIKFELSINRSDSKFLHLFNISEVEILKNKIENCLIEYNKLMNS